MASFETILDFYKELSADERNSLQALNKANLTPLERWREISKNILKPSHPFDLHLDLYNDTYKDAPLKPCWFPDEATAVESNVGRMMKAKGFTEYADFYNWSVAPETREEFWSTAIANIGVTFDTPPTSIFDLSRGVPHVSYLPGARLNVAKSCFNHRKQDETAIIYASESNPEHLQRMTYKTMDEMSNMIANAIVNKLGCKPGDAIGICMPMVPESISIYLGIVKAGCCVVSIADSFSAGEIETRCRLSDAKCVFTQDVIYRGTKSLPLFGRVLEAGVPQTVILPGTLHMEYSKTVDPLKPLSNLHSSISGLRRGVACDWDWTDFMSDVSTEFEPVIREATDTCNILFSSGTTGEPKAIVWSHATPIKCAVDGYLHQDVRIGETVAWPTNIGWMMGPWLMFQLMNGATIALFNGTTSTAGFCKFIELAEVSLLGVIPSLVKAWHANNTTKDCSWDKVRRYSSTGEASDARSMLWLMSRATGYSPVIEYCGGTEIGGSFLSSTVVQPNVPAMFATPVLGSALCLLNDAGVLVQGSGSGEIALMPPALGLSTKLLNRDHFETYYAGMQAGPNGETLRRHGDEIEAVCDPDPSSPLSSMPYYRALGRCDDTMNLGGIKISSVEIERVCNQTPGVLETAAIAIVPVGGGASVLVLYVVLKTGPHTAFRNVDGNWMLLEEGTDIDRPLAASGATLKSLLQNSIRRFLNPLFHVNDIVVAELLPRTASNKVMRRVMRDEYLTLEHVVKRRAQEALALRTASS